MLKRVDLFLLIEVGGIPNQFFLLALGPSLDLGFPFPRCRDIVQTFAVYQHHRTATGSVFCAGPLVMFADAVCQIVGSAGIQRVICAPDYIEKPFAVH